MSADPAHRVLPSPWKEFFTEIDASLSGPLELHCIGGFTLVHFYGLPRATGYIDYYTAIPNDVDLEAMEAGILRCTGSTRFIYREFRSSLFPKSTSRACSR